MSPPCFRCQGLLVPESFSVSGTSEILRTAKCVNCGVVYDPLILYNQSNQEVKKRLVGSKDRKFSCRGFSKRRNVLTKG